MVRVSRVVPKDWVKYSPIGNAIPNTPFVVFKTPLCDSLFTKIPKDKRFDVGDLFKQLAMRGEHLGMLVDLTDTDRYYEKRDVTGAFVKYKKINCPGRGFIERDECVEEFHKCIQEYIDRNEDKEALIGVHSTHGINRSGYMICRFLIDRLGWSSHEALDAFEQARGYPIEKGAYVQALHKAAMDARKRTETDSDGSERKKKKKNKRKHREVDSESDMVISSLINELGQQNQLRTNFSSPMEDSPQQPHWQSVVKKSKYQRLDEAAFQQTVSAEDTSSPAQQQEEGDEEEDEDDYEEEFDETTGSGIGGQVDVIHQTTASKRRARRARKQKLFEVMRRGNFHEIQAIQAEFVSNFGPQE